jgi:hypothetical protein
VGGVRGVVKVNRPLNAPGDARDALRVVLEMIEVVEVI